MSAKSFKNKHRKRKQLQWDEMIEGDEIEWLWKGEVHKSPLTPHSATKSI